MRARTLVLDAEQRAELAHARDRDWRPYVRERCAGVLKIAGGRSCRWVALFGLHKPRKPETVRRWLDRYLAGGLAALADPPRRRPRGP